ncbi:leucine-rich repeat domain-containing protein [Ruminococcus albus]|uniref:Leucine rich repeat-containing protein n=1 Tax=Ruminococcus albus TaxID=1264 RepID=A0A1I1EGF7_RUMAL|nr:leucine-rich repeat domain-containing protein [Ruminococcus albus]SFB86205.1 Leucine rich repeat-containing protein [Ruminococcus albus]
MTLNEAGQKAVARPRKKRYIVAAILLGLIAVYAILGAVFWKIGMPAFMFGYKKNDNGGITITNYYGTYLHVHIPDKIDGLDVTEIGRRVFDNDSDSHSVKTKFKSLVCRNIREVRLPDTVEKIGSFAFHRCYNLTDVNIPSSLRETGECIFTFTSIKEIELPEGMTKIEHLAFGYLPYLEKVTLPDSIEELGDGAFADCNNLKEINLPDGLKIVNAYAFEYCKDLKEINLPDGLKKVGVFAFYGSALSKVTLPDSVEEIYDYAFANCNDLKEINVPDGLKKISSNAFLKSELSDEQIQAFYDKAEEVID